MKELSIIVALLLGLMASASAAPDGAQIYRKLCAECHGPNGEGGTDGYRDRLVGDQSLAKLTSVIHKTMPEDDEKACRDEDAAAVAKYIYEAFYSREAQARNRQAHIEFSRLTARQFEESVADIFSEFTGRGHPDLKRPGLLGRYYASRGYDNKKKRFERDDSQISFQFGQGTPQEGKFEAHEFAINWSGSLIVEDTGFYEFNVKTENGFRLYVNDRENALIDGWVASGSEPSDHKASIKLLGGRAYPIALEWFKWKDKSASVELRWKPPNKVEEVIPPRHLAANGLPGTLVLQTVFPPDDASVGYPRGTAVSKAWADATTKAALEISDTVLRYLDHLSRSKEGDKDRTQKVKDFCARMVELAYRRPLSEEERKHYVDRQFERAKSESEAVTRVVLLTFTSPRFLYPEWEQTPYAASTRLALGLWDSIPDKRLLDAARNGSLKDRKRLQQAARQMVDDPRTRTKLRHFFHRWLMMDEADRLAKDNKTFPGFDEQVISDLRTSLTRFIDDIVWDGDADYRRLLLGNELFLNARLAEWYGGDKSKLGDQFEKVSFDPAQRAGVVTHPYMLASLAYHNTTSPIHRGVFLTRNVLGRTLKPPPEAVEFVDSKFEPNLTMREKVAELTRPANCQTCHSVINPLGFSLEQYDAVGRFRTHDQSKPIPDGGEYHTLSGETVMLTGARSIAEYAARSEVGQRNFIVQLFNEVAKQPVQAYGPTALDDLHHAFKKANFNIRALLVEIAVLTALQNEGS